MHAKHSTFDKSSSLAKMPESTQLYTRNVSYPLAMESPVNLDFSFTSATGQEDSSTTAESIDMNTSARTMSVESLNTLLNRLPEISIPPTLHNPLPLQCLAANALPDGVRQEIDGVIAQYTDPATVGSAEAVDQERSCTDSLVSRQEDYVAEEEGLAAVDKDIDTLTAALHKALGIGEVTSPTCITQETAPVSRLTLHRENDKESCCGFGLKISGGVRCNNCNGLHAIITGVSPCLYEQEEITEGLCVVEWNDQVLDGCSFEEVQRLLSVTDTQSDNIELSVKKCSENLQITRGGFDWLPSFAAVRLNKRRNAISQYMEDTDSKSIDSDGSSPESSIRSTSHLREHLDLPLSEPVQIRLPSSNRSHSISRSPSPCESRKPLEVTIPHSDVTTQALLASMEGRPKSPSHNSLGSIMNRLPNGMVQLCLDYNNEYEELNVILWQVKGQSSKEFSDTSDVFINTYLVPDSRQQGVRSIKVHHTKKDSTLTSSEYHNTSYMVSKDDIDSIALRVILWDAHKSKNIIFRGEVLLGLSDRQIVNLESEPTWYTVCPADPNLSILPQPVHYKHKDNLLQRLKQKAHSLTNVKHPLLKTSSSISCELKASSTLSLPGTVEKRSLTLIRKKPKRDTRKTHSGSFAPQFLNMLESEMKAELKDDQASDENGRLEKLSSILNVLREDGEAVVDETDDGLNTHDTKNHSLSDILGVLQDYTSPTLESTDGGCEYSGVLQDRVTSSSLARRPRSTLRPSSAVIESQVNLSAKHSIPRGSLKAKPENGVSNYSFLAELEKYIKRENFGLQSVPQTEQTHGTHQDEQVHYKLIDRCHSEDDLDSPNKSEARSSLYRNSKSSDFLSYPAEVSLHRINVEDVDEKNESDFSKRSCTLPSSLRGPQPRPKTLLPREGVTDKRPPKPPKKIRSKSVGDMDDLESEGEVLLVRSPYTPASLPGDVRYGVDSGSSDYLDAVEPLRTCMSENNDGLSSLDFGNRDCLNQSVDCVLDSDLSDGLDGEEQRVVPRKKSSMLKWKSLEDILGPKPKKTKKVKSSRKNSTLVVPNRASYVKRNSVPENGNSSTGNVKLEFQYNDLNKAQPVLMVKLTDVVLKSTNSSDFLMKCYVNHISSGVCILKDKTTVNLKNSSPSVPLGILQFQTEIANLSAQVLLCGASKVFSRKVIGQVSVDLTSLDLSDGRVFSQWFTLSKDTHV